MHFHTAETYLVAIGAGFALLHGDEVARLLSATGEATQKRIRAQKRLMRERQRRERLALPLGRTWGK